MNYSQPLNILPISSAYFQPENQLDQPSTPLSPQELVKLGKLGKSGTLIYNGIITGEEYQTDLQGKQAITIYDQMFRSDASVRASLRILELPILGVEWDIEPASDDPQDVEAADMVRSNLFDHLEFYDSLRQALIMLRYGFSVFEKVFDVLEINGKSYIGIDKLGYRKPYSIFKWEQQTGEPGITQFIANVGLIDIPKDKLVIFTNEKEGQNYEGISALRPAYLNWYMKKALVKIQTMSAERQGLGIPMFIPPTNASEADKIKARQQMQNLRANEFAYIEVPQGYVVDFMDMKAHTTVDIQPMLQYHDREILKNVLAQFLEIGSHSGSGGAKSSSQDQSRFLDLSLEAVAKNITNTINEGIIKHLVDLNFNVTEYPRLTHTKIVDQNPAVVADAVQKFVDAGVLTPDPDLEQFIRDILHTPDLPDEIRDNYENRLSTTTFQPPDATGKAPLLSEPGTQNQEDIADQGETTDEKMEDISASNILAEAKVLTGKVAGYLAEHG